MRKTTIISLLTVSLALIGCEGEPQPAPPTPEVKPQAPVVETIPDKSNPLANTITLAGATFQVNTQGTVAPNAQIDVSITQTSGNRVGSIRVWIGDESGIGSMKIRTHSHGKTAHAHAPAPAVLPEDCALWIEVQNANGETASGSIVLN